MKGRKKRGSSRSLSPHSFEDRDAGTKQSQQKRKKKSRFSSFFSSPPSATWSLADNPHSTKLREEKEKEREKEEKEREEEEEEGPLKIRSDPVQVVLKRGGEEEGEEEKRRKRISSLPIPRRRVLRVSELSLEEREEEKEGSLSSLQSPFSSSSLLSPPLTPSSPFSSSSPLHSPRSRSSSSSSLSPRFKSVIAHYLSESPSLSSLSLSNQPRILHPKLPLSSSPPSQIVYFLKEREEREERGERGERGERVERREREKFLSCDCYFDIVHFLVSELSLEGVEAFFLGFEQSFEVDHTKLLETMKELLSKEGNKEEEEKKEKNVQIVLSWRKILGFYYRAFKPLIAQEMEDFLDSLSSPLAEKTLICKGMNLSLCGSSTQVAQMLTSIMFQMYKNIKPGEFFDGFWEKKDKHLQSPNITAMSEIFNRISSMVVESILFDDNSSQIQSLMFAIKLANHLLKMRNFEGWAAVVSGLNQSPIYRLKSLWNSLSSRYKKRYELFDEFSSPEFNFKKYRTLLQSAEPPLLPWFAPKLRELRYLYDGNHVENTEGLVNFSHLLQIGKTIREFLQYQSFEYDPVHSDKTLLIKFLETRSISEDLCYKKSVESSFL